MAKSILRVCVLFAIATVALIGLFGTPLDDSPSWERDLFLSKIVGFIAAFAFSGLYSRWLKVDKWIKAYDRWCRGNRSKLQNEPIK